MVIPGLVVVLIWRSFFFEATAGPNNKYYLYFMDRNAGRVAELTGNYFAARQ